MFVMQYTLLDMSGVLYNFFITQIDDILNNISILNQNINTCKVGNDMLLIIKKTFQITNEMTVSSFNHNKYPIHHRIRILLVSANYFSNPFPTPACFQNKREPITLWNDCSSPEKKNQHKHISFFILLAEEHQGIDGEVYIRKLNYQQSCFS